MSEAGPLFEQRMQELYTITIRKHVQLLRILGYTITISHYHYGCISNVLKYVSYLALTPRMIALISKDDLSLCRVSDLQNGKIIGQALEKQLEPIYRSLGYGKRIYKTWNR